MLDKIVMVVGATGGIGEAIAKKLDSDGATVVLVGRNKEKLSFIAEKLSHKPIVISYDLSKLEDIESIFEKVSENEKKLDGLVFAAGVNRDTPIKSNNIEMMIETMTVNAMSFVEISKYFIRRKYSKDGAAIVAISSNATNEHSSGMCTYTASKAALEAEIKVLSKEAIKRKIRVNGIAPACVRTDMVLNAPFLDLKVVNERQPLGIIEPEDVAGLTAYLLSDQARFITGTTISMTAGA